MKKKKNAKALRYKCDLADQTEGNERKRWLAFMFNKAIGTGIVSHSEAPQGKKASIDWIRIPHPKPMRRFYNSILNLRGVLACFAGKSANEAIYTLDVQISLTCNVAEVQDMILTLAAVYFGDTKEPIRNDRMSKHRLVEALRC